MSTIESALQALIESNDLKGIVALKAQHRAKQDQELIGQAMDTLRFQRVKALFDENMKK